LRQIGAGNPTAIDALLKLIQTSQDESAHRRAAETLGKIGAGNQSAIDALVKLIQTSQYESTRRLAAVSLKKTSEKTQMAAVVSALKDYLSEQTYKNNSNQYHNCYSLLWHYAQTLPYPNFYQAWHQKEGVGRRQSGEENTTTPSIPTLNLAELPKLLRAAIDSDSQLTDEVQLICIDGSKFCDRDNPATKIYNEMRRQGCPKSEDSKPKTMAQLQDYWDELSLDSDKHLVLVFYERTPLALLTKAPVAKGGIREEVGFSNTFLSDLSKFDGAICLVTEQLNIPLKSFSLSQPNLIEDIVEWIRRTALER
jgi:hypothetical protein